MQFSITDEQRAAATAWLTTPVRCPRRCPDCEGSGCGITPEDYPGLFTTPAGLGLAVSVVREELEREYKEYLAGLNPPVAATEEPEASTEGGEVIGTEAPGMTEEEIHAWLGAEVPCETDCAGGCEGAGCGYTREGRMGYLKDVPPAVTAYLQRKWEEDLAYEQEKAEEYAEWMDRYMEEQSGDW
jgi:hypothetical protein